MEYKLKVSGMSCSACSSAVERIVSKMPETENVSVNLTTGKLSFNSDAPADEIIEKVITKVNKAGYPTEVDKSLKTVKIPIEGMTCSACSAAVERGLNKMPAIEEVNVNLTTNMASVTYDEDQVRLSEIKAKISKIGYTPKEILVEETASIAISESEKNMNTMWRRFVIAAVFTVPLFYITMGHMIGLPIPNFLHPDTHPTAFAMYQLLLTLPVVISGHKFYTVGFKTLIKRNPNMDSLIAVSTSAAMLYSIYGTYSITQGKLHYAHHLYYETAAVIITLITLGKFLESRSKAKTSDAIKKLINLQPKQATVIVDGNQVVLPIEEVSVGDTILIKPGETVPLDGTIIKGESAIDEAMISGESIPVEKTIDDAVIGGSINTNGALEVIVDKVGKDTILSQIIRMVEDAQSKKAPIAKIADVISGYFVPAVMTIAVVAGLIWWFVTQDIAFSLKIFIAVLVIACPCALGLATPTAIMVATGNGAERGILFKSGESLENTHKIDTVVLDKTGTITEGKPQVVDYLPAIQDDNLLQMVASAEAVSEHPLAKAIIDYTEQQGVQVRPIDKFEYLTGRGLIAQIEDNTLLIGNRLLLEEQGITVLEDEKINALATQGKTPVLLALNDKFAGVIAIQDPIKETSIQAIAALHARNIECIMLTGDNGITAQAIAKQANLDNVISEVLPHQKADVIKDLAKKNRNVAMVGDGINDAPALAHANVGFAIGSGTDIAVDSADIVLMKNDLNDVIKAIDLSSATIKNIKQNLFWAFFYNILGIPVAAGVLHAFGGPLLSPMIGAAAMSMSSVSVVTNALRLRKRKD